MVGQPNAAGGQLATPEDALRAAASFLQADLDLRGSVVRGRVAWEYVVQISPGNGRAFDLRVKVWPSTIGALPYRYARNVHAQGPSMMTPYVGNDVAGTVLEALQKAIGDTLFPIRQGQDAGHVFNDTWLTLNPAYATTPGFGD
ncbi:MAG: hypothetical protein ACN6RJ_08305 [Stenotrophomonas sp.]